MVTVNGTIFFFLYIFIPFLFDFYGRKKPDSFPGLLHILRCFEPYEPCTEGFIHVFWIHIFIFIHGIGNIPSTYLGPVHVKVNKQK